MRPASAIFEGGFLATGPLLPPAFEEQLQRAFGVGTAEARAIFGFLDIDKDGYLELYDLLDALTVMQAAYLQLPPLPPPKSAATLRRGRLNSVNFDSDDEVQQQDGVVFGDKSSGFGFGAPMFSGSSRATTATPTSGRRQRLASVMGIAGSPPPGKKERLASVADFGGSASLASRQGMPSSVENAPAQSFFPGRQREASIIGSSGSFIPAAVRPRIASVVEGSARSPKPPNGRARVASGVAGSAASPKPPGGRVRVASVVEGPAGSPTSSGSSPRSRPFQRIQSEWCSWNEDLDEEDDSSQGREFVPSRPPSSFSSFRDSVTPSDLINSSAPSPLGRGPRAHSAMKGAGGFDMALASTALPEDSDSDEGEGDANMRSDLPQRPWTSMGTDGQPRLDSVAGDSSAQEAHRATKFDGVFNGGSVFAHAGRPAGGRDRGGIAGAARGSIFGKDSQINEAGAGGEEVRGAVVQSARTVRGSVRQENLPHLNLSNFKDNAAKRTNRASVLGATLPQRRASPKRQATSNLSAAAPASASVLLSSAPEAGSVGAAGHVAVAAGLAASGSMRGEGRSSRLITSGTNKNSMPPVRGSSLLANRLQQQPPQ